MGAVAKTLAMSIVAIILVLAWVLLESLDEMAGILLHVALEILHEFMDREERLIVVHAVTYTERRCGVNASAEFQTIGVAVDNELHTGVGLVPEGDVAAFINASGHFGCEICCDVPDFEVCKIAFHICVFLNVVNHFGGYAHSGREASH